MLVSLAYKTDYLIGVGISILLFGIGCGVLIELGSIEFFPFLGVLLYFNYYNQIYIQLDLKTRKVYFGNLAYKREASFTDMKVIRKTMLSHFFKVKIGTKSYRFYAPHFKKIKCELSETLKETKIE